MSLMNDTFTAWRIPLYVLLEWPKADLEHPVIRRWSVPIYLALWALGTVCLLGRSYARYQGRAGRLAIDDTILGIAWIFATISIVTSIYGVLGAGFDRHVWDALVFGGRQGVAAWVHELTFIIGSSLAKASVLVFYRRIFAPVKFSTMRWAVDFALFITLAFMTAISISIIFACSPVHAFWDASNPTYGGKYHCFDRHIYDPIKGLISVISDIFCLLLPQIVISRLKLETGATLRLSIIFGCGILATLAGIARTVELTRLYSDPLRDLTWVGHDVFLWAEVEIQLGIICASVPMITTLFRPPSQAVQDMMKSKSAERESQQPINNTTVQELSNLNP
ncbi:hypothetical protein BT63DRAFT_421832 [Microthyrium microscopicum]|uniref:Rhodopsin domain-containing protein n=1 Tax=Microthyrium microscopicum TaxID=703497 RepID=A0A6A6UQJ4_9PEZI|nr:hypothetical protein BT63DRAFT_421832 [Microthyrium microscopicum]